MAGVPTQIKALNEYTHNGGVHIVAEQSSSSCKFYV